MSLADEQKSLQKLLTAKTISKVFRRKKRELGLEFSDGTRLFIDCRQDQSLELSVTGGEKD